MAHIHHADKTPAKLRAAISHMDAISQNRFRFIERLTRRVIAGSATTDELLRRIAEVTTEAMNDINCSAEAVGCNYVGSHA